MDVKYKVTITSIIDTALTGEEPKIQEKVLADSTTGPAATVALLNAVAESIEKGRKPMNWAMVANVVAQTLAKESAKRKKAGGPSLIDDLKDLLGDKTQDETTR